MFTIDPLSSKKYSSTYLVQNEIEMKVNIDTFGVPVSEKLAEV